jgi:hypothetical protein
MIILNPFRASYITVILSLSNVRWHGLRNKQMLNPEIRNIENLKQN